MLSGAAASCTAPISAQADACGEVDALSASVCAEVADGDTTGAVRVEGRKEKSLPAAATGLLHI